MLSQPRNHCLWQEPGASTRPETILKWAVCPGSPPAASLCVSSGPDAPAALHRGPIPADCCPLLCVTQSHPWNLKVIPSHGICAAQKEHRKESACSKRHDSLRGLVMQRGQRGVPPGAQLGFVPPPSQPGVQRAKRGRRRAWARSTRAAPLCVCSSDLRPGS